MSAQLQVGPVRRSLRRLTLGSGPLKRRSDRLQVLGRVIVALAFLVAPPLAVATSTVVSAHLEEVADAEAAERSLTRATLLEDAPPALLPTGPGDLGATLGVPVGVGAEWSDAGGTSREGTVAVRPGTPAGTTVPVWVDDAGRLTRAPLDPSAIPARATVAAVSSLIGLPLTACLLYGALCRALDLQRERRWGREWAAVEADWHSRLL